MMCFYNVKITNFKLIFTEKGKHTHFIPIIKSGTQKLGAGGGWGAIAPIFKAPSLEKYAQASLKMPIKTFEFSELPLHCYGQGEGGV